MLHGTMVAIFALILGAAAGAEQSLGSATLHLTKAAGFQTPRQEPVKAVLMIDSGGRKGSVFMKGQAFEKTSLVVSTQDVGCETDEKGQPRLPSLTGAEDFTAVIEIVEHRDAKKAKEGVLRQALRSLADPKAERRTPVHLHGINLEVHGSSGKLFGYYAGDPASIELHVDKGESALHANFRDPKWKFGEPMPDGMVVLTRDQDAVLASLNVSARTLFGRGELAGKFAVHVCDSVLAR